MVTADSSQEDKTCFGIGLMRLLAQDAKSQGVESTQADVDSLHELTYSMRFKVSSQTFLSRFPVEISQIYGTSWISAVYKQYRVCIQGALEEEELEEERPQERRHSEDGSSWDIDSGEAPPRKVSSPLDTFDSVDNSIMITTIYMIITASPDRIVPTFFLHSLDS